jgi:hypothetical protein
MNDTSGLVQELWYSGNVLRDDAVVRLGRRLGTIAESSASTSSADGET